MDILGWLIAGHGLIWMILVFFLVPYFPAFVHLRLVQAGLAIPLVWTINFLIGYLQVCLGLFIALDQWRKIIALVTLISLIIAALFLFAWYKLKPGDFVILELH